MASPLLNPVMTLAEYAKGPDIPDEARPLIEMFATKSDVLEALPFMNLGGFVLQGYRQAALQTAMAFRAINAPSTSGAGVLTPYQESTFVIDHDIPVDRVLRDRGGDRRMAQEGQMAMARLAELVTNTLIKGDNTVTNTVFNGMQKRAALYGRTIDNAGGVAGGTPLSLFQLDNAIWNTNSATHIVAPWAMMPRWTQAARNTTLTGFVMQTWDGVGKPKMSYSGLPILFGFPKDLHPPILPFTEVAAGGGAAQTSSVYIVNFSEEGLCGIQNKPMEIRDFGLLPDGITYNTHVSWDIGLVDNKLFCLTRLSGITNTAIVL
jgi:hypothetical protein